MNLVSLNLCGPSPGANLSLFNAKFYSTMEFEREFKGASEASFARGLAAFDRTLYNKKVNRFD